jgi:hypothetical protein
VVVPVGAKQRHGEAPGFTGSGVPVAAAAVSSASGGAAAAAAGLTARRRPLSGSLMVAGGDHQAPGPGPWRAPT